MVSTVATSWLHKARLWCSCLPRPVLEREDRPTSDLHRPLLWNPLFDLRCQAALSCAPGPTMTS